MVTTSVKAKQDSSEVVEVKIPVLLPHRILLYVRCAGSIDPAGGHPAILGALPGVLHMGPKQRL